MEERYIAVGWPECQYFLEDKDTAYDPHKDIWFVKETIYNKFILNVQNEEYDYGHNVKHTND